MTRPALRLRARLRALGVALLLAAVPVTVAGPAHADDGGFVSRINSERAAAGLPSLSSSGELASVAAGWAAHMASSGDLAHNPGLASQVSGYRFVGENVGYGPDAGTIHAAFMASPGHRANVLDTDYTQVGVAVTVDGNGRMWVAEVFRAPIGSASAPAAGPSSGSSSGSSSGTSSGSSSATTRTSRARTTTPAPPPPPTPEQLLQQRASAAAAGPGASPAPDVLAEVVRFTQVMASTHG